MVSPIDLPLLRMACRINRSGWRSAAFDFFLGGADPASPPYRTQRVVFAWPFEVPVADPIRGQSSTDLSDRRSFVARYRLRRPCVYPAVPGCMNGVGGLRDGLSPNRCVLLRWVIVNTFTAKRARKVDRFTNKFATGPVAAVKNRGYDARYVSKHSAFRRGGTPLYSAGSRTWRAHGRACCAVSAARRYGGENHRLPRR